MRVKVQLAPLTVIVAVSLVFSAALRLHIVLFIFTLPQARWAAAFSSIAEVDFLPSTYELRWVIFWYIVRL